MKNALIDGQPRNPVYLSLSFTEKIHIYTNGVFFKKKRRKKNEFQKFMKEKIHW